MINSIWTKGDSLFYTVDKESKSKLYIMRFCIDGSIIHKVGVTTRKPEERLVEILLSFYKAHRYIPKCDIKRFKEVDDVFGKESMLHSTLKEYKYSAEKKFSGCTEMFINIDEFTLLELYDRCVAGEVLGTLVKMKVEKGDMEGVLCCG